MNADEKNTARGALIFTFVAAVVARLGWETGGVFTTVIKVAGETLFGGT